MTAEFDSPETILDQLLSGQGEPELLLQAPLPDEVAQAVIDGLKQEADRHWYIDPQRSQQFAEMIIQIGRLRDDREQIALGLMAYGDARKFLGHLADAWDSLEEAGNLFQEAGSEYGWARTRIGRLYISVDLQRVQQALQEAALAEEIFHAHNDTEMLLRLKLNTAVVYDYTGQHQQALELYDEALVLVHQLGDQGAAYLGPIYTNKGYAHNFLGDFRQALTYYERAHAIFTARGEVTSAATAELNIAYSLQAQGQYRRALSILHRVAEQTADHLPLESALARREMVECYLNLNRYREARDLARQVLARYRELDADYGAARTLLYIATAEAELGHTDAALAALDEAAPIYAALQTPSWTAMVHLRRGQIALRRGEIAAALGEAQVAQGAFRRSERAVNFAEALLLEGQARFAADEIDAAARCAHDALHIARRGMEPALRYSAHLLLGRIVERRGRVLRAIRRYQGAAATVARVQRSLTITLRPGFLEDKGEALRSLVRLHLQTGAPQRAFEALENAKSQLLLGELANREQFRWSAVDAQSTRLLEELNRLRQEHHWYYRAARAQPLPDEQKDLEPPRARNITPAAAGEQLAQIERRMRYLTEQLYVRSGGEAERQVVTPPSLAHIQAALDPDAVLVEYFHDGQALWAFALTADDLHTFALGPVGAEIDDLIARWQANVDRALRVGADSPVAHNLGRLAQRIASNLYQRLLAPLAAVYQRARQLVVVPYGALHYLPFHLLHTGQAYLVETHEIVVLPAAGLLTRQPPRCVPGALVLAHSHDGRLPHTAEEAGVVTALLRRTAENDVHALFEDQAAPAALEAAPRQVLHIAAHGEHRIDQPDFSYIQLASGQVFTDDLLQYDLSYELVTLSACETGRARVAPGDELIGLGRGILYAGAGALIASLWRVDDVRTVELMRAVYRALCRGSCKSAALREAQLAMLQREPALHPAYWGAFQLVGSDAPLSLPAAS